MEVVAIDIGGTHVRFAIATLANGRVAEIGAPITLHTADHAALETAWQAYAGQACRALPRAVALSVASPIGGEVIKLTNNSWTIRPSLIPERMGVERFTVVNDFAAIAHAVAQLPEADFEPICGPGRARHDQGVTSVCGPGTGLGVAAIVWNAERYQVLATEGGHVDFAPLDAIEDKMLRRLRQRLTRVSAERICAGPGIVAIHETLAAIEGKPVRPMDDKALWTLALAGSDPLAVAALDRFLLALGAFAGDLALAHGAQEMVIAGGLGLRLKNHFARSGFADRFTAKGRFRQMLADIPVRLITYPEPGLYGAAAAFAQEHCR